MWDDEWLSLCLAASGISLLRLLLGKDSAGLCCCRLSCLYSLDFMGEIKHLDEGSGMKTLEWGPAMGRSPSVPSFLESCVLPSWNSRGKAGADPAGMKPWLAEAQSRDLLGLLLPLYTQQSSTDAPLARQEGWRVLSSNQVSLMKLRKFISIIINSFYRKLKNRCEDALHKFFFVRASV